MSIAVASSSTVKGVSRPSTLEAILTAIVGEMRSLLESIPAMVSKSSVCSGVGRVSDLAGASPRPPRRAFRPAAR